jgi:hypothetical protein
MSAQSTPINVTGTGSVIRSPGTYRGIRVRDTSGSANTVTLYDNASAASGTVLATFVLAANAADGEDINDGMHVSAGIYLQSTGSLVGCVRVG